MKSFATLVLLCLAASLLISDDNPKVLKLKKLNSTIVIDGVIDEMWSQADSVSDFVQYMPYNGRDPSYHTTAKVLTTEDALYCLIVCEADADRLQKITGMLDNMGGEVVSIMLDTFGDSRTAYKFAVTATGVRGDCRLLDDARDRDYSWDGVWFSDAEIYDWGFVVEIEIPYRTIQYDKTLTSWGLDFDRWVPEKQEDIYWCPYEENEGQRISKFGRLLFEDFRPSVEGLNLELYPIGLAKTAYHDPYDDPSKSVSDINSYNNDFQLGLDVFYNPSPQLTFQGTVNPDFAQIEADPFNFNISRYESYFSERRPFFTQGNEIFMIAGRQRNTGFYSPLEFFYSRRIGKLLPDGTEVPIVFGAKAFGRIEDTEYGGFAAHTAETPYVVTIGSRGDPTDPRRDTTLIENKAWFGSARVRQQILGNSSIGGLFVGRYDRHMDNGLLDVDGALRTSDWQLAYQLGRSFKSVHNPDTSYQEGGYAVSAGFTLFAEKYIAFVRGNYIEDDFDIDQVGFVPWRGTGELVTLVGPRWYYDEGEIRSILIYGGGYVDYEKVDSYTDHGGLIGYNMQFRSNWGFELNANYGKAKDVDFVYNGYEISLSSWWNVSPDWHLNVYGGYAKTYNFRREYLGYYAYPSVYFQWNVVDVLQIGTSFNSYIEWRPDHYQQDITLNARPFFTLVPINDMSFRVYVDNVFVKSTDHFERFIIGFLFSYNFLPKSWIHLAINEVQDRRDRYDAMDNLLPNKVRVSDRVGVLKIRYLYYF